jgi:hypothetical protein
MIAPKTILLTPPDDASPHEVATYAQADEVARKLAVTLTGGKTMPIRVVIVFRDLFVWTTSLTLSGKDRDAENLVQRTIKSEWEFNGGVRPAWWPETPESDHMWGVHYREDRDNGRAELARLRLERYDLTPVKLSALPPRDASPLPPIERLVSSR